MSNRSILLILSALCWGLLLTSLAAAQSTPVKCGPDHAILYKKAVKILDSAEKKLNAKYTAEAKAQVKEANSLFSILVEECGPLQQGRALTEREREQEAANNKKKDEYYDKGMALEKSAKEHMEKARQAEAKGQDDLAARYYRQAKAENEQAHAAFIQAEIYALRNQEMIFKFLAN
jgi:exonuclease VII small subunit